MPSKAKHIKAMPIVIDPKWLQGVVPFSCACFAYMFTISPTPTPHRPQVIAFLEQASPLLRPICENKKKNGFAAF